MGKEKTTVVSSGTTTPTPTAEETELNRLYLERERAAQSGMIGAQTQGLNLVNQLLTGGTLPGYLGTLTQGISSEAIGEQASRLAGQYGAGFQSLGLGDSGIAYRETARGIANELLYPTEQFNIGNIQNLLNLALSGQAQVQQPVLAQGSTLSSALAGLRSMSYTGTQTTTGMNPFLKSFQTSLGSSLGQGIGSGLYKGLPGFGAGGMFT